MHTSKYLYAHSARVAWERRVGNLPTVQFSTYPVMIFSGPLGGGQFQPPQ